MNEDQRKLGTPPERCSGGEDDTSVTRQEVGTMPMTTPRELVESRPKILNASAMNDLL